MLTPSNEKGNRRFGRRAFLTASGAALAALAYWRLTGSMPDVAGASPAALPAMVSIADFTDAGVREKVVTVPTIVKTDAEWHKQLSPDSYEITRNAGTERPGSGALLNEHRKGVFRCICCDTALFSSDTKFESGTGWPSFWAPIAKENIVETRDTTFNIVRTAVSCRRCDSHMGHVFDDGPRPTGLRYCMNSLALKFAKA